MKVRYLIAMAAALSISATAFAIDEDDGGEELFKKHNCTTCHSIDKKIAGPALKDIAAKYRGDKEAQARLEKKVRSGGSGVWGKMPMPPAPKTVKDEHIKTIIQWVLSLK